MCYGVQVHTARRATGRQIERRKPAEKVVDYCPKKHLTLLRIQASFIIKGKGVWLVFANFLVQESFVLAAVPIGFLTMFL